MRPVDKEATEIANLILSLQEKHPDKTIAILVRARNHLKSIIKEFRDRKIKFQAEDIDSLTSNHKTHTWRGRKNYRIKPSRQASGNRESASRI